MPTLKNLRVTALICGLSLGLTTQAVAKTPPGQKCSASKRAAAGKGVAAVLACYAKSASKGVPVDAICLSKATTKLTEAFAKAEKGGGCIKVGDAPFVADNVSDFSSFLAELLPPAVEICSNAKDDDLNGDPDCDDFGCSHDPVCNTCGNGVREGAEAPRRY